jgi:hypothetical protein
MRLRNASLALATAIVALGVTSLADGASAQSRTNWIPLADPAGGPNFYPLDEDARYQSRGGSGSDRLDGTPFRDSIAGRFRADRRGREIRGMGGSRMNGGMRRP